MSYIDSLGGPGVWNWRQNIHYRRTGDFVWNSGQLGAGVDLLDWRGDGGYLAIIHWKTKCRQNDGRK